MKRFIDIHIPITKCNLNCHYCYVAQECERNNVATPFMYSPEHIGKALTQERLGGICHFNVCGLGETLIPEETVRIVYELLKNGHYVFIVTNAILTNRILEFVNFPEEYRKRLGFKCSFHYLELVKKDLLKKYFSNVELIKKNGMSFSIEMTPSDELEPYIDEIKKITLENVGAYPHVTIPRDMTKSDIVLLSKHSASQFYDIWKTFNSDMLDFKYQVWGQKRKEFCHAGEWSGLLNIGNGIMTQCYGECLRQNILKDINKPIEWIPVGHNCPMPHCYNSHSLLGVGDISAIDGNYALERDRVDMRDGSHWLTSEMREFLSHRLEDYNYVQTKKEEINCDKTWKNRMRKTKVKEKVKQLVPRKIKEMIKNYVEGSI